MRQIVKDSVVSFKDFEFNGEKIYILKTDYGLYKLCSLKLKGFHGFVALENSISTWDFAMERDILMKAVLNYSKAKLYEFNSFDEFVTWYSNGQA